MPPVSPVSNQSARRPAGGGLSLVEILVALAIFSTAMIGLYMAINGLSQTVATSMKRDIESSYVNMLISRINPFDPAIETAYDRNSTNNPGITDCTTSRCFQDLPNGDRFYYTVDVRSALTAADVKQVNFYLFRGATGATPYRQFRRDLELSQFYNFRMAGTPAYYKDVAGQVWSSLYATSPTYNGTDGSIRAGRDTTFVATWTAYNTATDPVSGVLSANGTVDGTVWKEGMSANPLALRFPATANRSYTIQLGFNETGGATDGQREMEVYINNQLVGTVDPVKEAGGANRALTKFYTATPTTVSGVSVINVRLEQKAGATQPPRLAWIALTRN